MDTTATGAHHIALLGDSIFDNGRYTGGEPDVVTHLRALLPSGWTATLCAIDGSVASSVSAQLPRIPSATTCIVVSVGGNDALRSEPLLHASSGSAVWRGLAAAQAEFAADYRAALVALKASGRKMLACTIYDGNLPAGDAAAARAALAVFNDVIYRTANELGVPVLELRRVCTEPSDYANPIEPSGTGGRKIARAIIARLGGTARRA